MRVLWLAHAIPYPPKAGFLLRSYYLLRALARHHQVDLVAFIQEQWMAALYPSVTEGIAAARAALGDFCEQVQFLPIDRLRRRNGKELIALAALLGGTSYTASWLVSTSARRAIAARLSANNYDLVHFDTIGLAAYRPLAGNRPATLMHHNIESHMMLRRSHNSRNVLARAYFRHEARLLANLEKRIAPEFNTHITCSELDSARLHELVPDASIVSVPNGVDCGYFRSKDAPHRANSLIFVGTLSWYPNVEAMMFLLQEIWPLLRQRSAAITLDIVGTGPPHALTALAASQPGVTVHGYVPDVRPLMDSAALYVCPIRDGGGTKLKILDAFAMSKCVVADPIACEGIAVTAERDVVLAKRPEEFAERILALLADEPRRRAMGRAARALVEQQYSFDAIGDRFSDVIGGAAGGHSQSAVNA